jgi:hypothetical protein
VTSNEESPIDVNTILWRQQKTHDWLGERAILAGKNKDVEERNNIIQSVTRKGHSNAWPGTASYKYKKVTKLSSALSWIVKNCDLIYQSITVWIMSYSLSYHSIYKQHRQLN